MRLSKKFVLCLCVFALIGTFAQAQNYVITFQTDGTGGATIDGATSQTVASGGDCTTVTANNPPSMFTFTHWTLSDDSTTSTNPIRPLSVATTETYTATYAENTPTPTPTNTPVNTSTPTPTATNTPTNTPTPTATPTGFIDTEIAINRKEFTNRYISTDTRTTTDSSSVSGTFTPAVPFYIEEIRTFIGPDTLTTGTVTISIDSGTTATANIVIDTLDMSSALYDSYQPTNPMLFDHDGQINIGAVHDATTVTRTTQIIWSKP